MGRDFLFQDADGSASLTLTRGENSESVRVASTKAGSVLMFHGCLVHASSPNISPWGRTIVYLSLCEVSNHITKFQRPEWIAHRDFTPIEALPDDCLSELVPYLMDPKSMSVLP